MFYIAQMSGKVEHAIADRHIPIAKLAISEVLATLDSDSYFRNVFKSDPENEEWKTRKALREGLHELLNAEV